jgi:hypothetical protein
MKVYGRKKLYNIGPRKEIVFTDIVKDEIIQCQKVTEEKCYTSQETVFDTFTVSDGSEVAAPRPLAK